PGHRDHAHVATVGHRRVLAAAQPPSRFPRAMSATETKPEADAETEAPVPGPKRLQPPQISILIGVLIALLVAVSGVAASVFEFHDDSPVQREVFGGIPSWLKVVFYAVLPIVFVIGS